MSAKRLIDIIKENPDIQWSLKDYIRDDEISIDDILASLHLPWPFEQIYHKRNITIQDLLKPIPKDKKGKPLWKWDWPILSSFIIHINDILANPQLPWDYGCVSSNRYLTFKHVLDNKDLNWDWKMISYHAKMSMRDILDNRYEKYYVKGLSYNRSLHIDDILAHPEFKWDMHYVSYNKSITIDHILKNLDLSWSWSQLSYHIPMQTIMKYPKLPWVWGPVSSNPTFDVKLALENVDIYIPFYYSTEAFKNKVTPETIHLYQELFTTYMELHKPENQKEAEKRFYSALSIYFKGPIEFIKSHLEYKWDIMQLLSNTNFTVNELVRLREFKLIDSTVDPTKTEDEFYNELFTQLSYHQRLTVQDIVDNPTIKWHYAVIHQWPNKVTVEDKLKHKHLPWFW